MASAALDKGFVDESWRLKSHKTAKVGDRVWLLRQGPGPKVIFGRGRITGPAKRDTVSNGEIQWMAPVRFDAIVDPNTHYIVGETETRKILTDSQLKTRASGGLITDEQSNSFEQVAKPTTTIPESGRRADWSEDELKAIVTDYFAMLQKEIAGDKYSKTQHRNALMQFVLRSPGSIERKHQNISAVLASLGLPWIFGYKPLSNFQDALLRAVEQALDQNLDLPDNTAQQPTTENELAEIVVSPPSPKLDRAKTASIRRMVRKYDTAARDAANRNLGNAGEDFVTYFEKKRLISVGRTDLASKVTWVSKTKGDGLGYDIESFDDDGEKIFIEVKTTRGPIDTPFFISPNELRVSAELGTSFRLYRAFSFGNNTKIYILKGPVEKDLKLEPASYRAEVGTED
ncbi:MAG: DUF3883 domain-containing protein [Xanthobacteraceae bacterium]|nr:DUF3883 domain-containing protein [Xanthobacteraceae bacterium]QYK45629.1 MAG: DUF3883 domain-containing protein [Xanthobacteraceae bacterium]